MLAIKNAEYDEKFGHVFLICATGKTADEMLTCLLQRLSNSPEDEVHMYAIAVARILFVSRMLASNCRTRAREDYRY